MQRSFRQATVTITRKHVVTIFTQRLVYMHPTAVVTHKWFRHEGGCVAIGMEGYSRCPRSLAHRAEAYLKASGIADTAYFGPEPEFFVFDDVRWDATINSAYYEVDSHEGDWNTGSELEGGNPGHRPRVKGGYFPVPPVDSLNDVRA